MPTRPTLPPAGTRFTPGSVGRVLGQIIKSTANQNFPTGMGGIVSSHGTNLALGAGVAIAIFELIENFNHDDLPDGMSWPFQPADCWYHAKATKLEYYPGSGQQEWNTPDGEGDSNTVAETVYVWAPAGYQVDSNDAKRTLPDAMQIGDPPAFSASACAGMWVWCYYDPGATVWVLMDTFAKSISGRLTEDLYQCSSAAAYLETFVNGKKQYKIPIRVYDDIGTVANQVMQEFDSGGQSYIPAGTCFYADFYADRGDPTGSGDTSGSGEPSGGKWEVKQFGDCCQAGSEESGESGQSGEVSGESGQSGGGSGSGQQESGEGKSAIVPAAWSPTGYAGVFITEMPEVRFNDVMVVNFPAQDGIELCDPSKLFPIEHKFLATCHVETLEVIGHSEDIPVLVGVRVEGENLRVRVTGNEAVRIVFHMSGIRKGFKGIRLPPKTRAQFIANERFIKKAYYGK